MDIEQLMTIADAAKLKSLGRAAIYAAMERGEIRFEIVLGKERPYRKDVEAYVPRKYTGKRENARPEGVRGPGGRPRKHQEQEFVTHG